MKNSVRKLLIFKSEKIVKTDSIEQKKSRFEEFEKDENNNAEGNAINLLDSYYFIYNYNYSWNYFPHY